MTREQRLNALIRNGITPDDLSNAYSDGYAEGFAEASPNVTQTIYAAVVLALRDEDPPWDRDSICRLLTCLDGHVVSTLNSREAIDKVWEDVGLQLEFGDPIEPIKERESRV